METNKENVPAAPQTAAPDIAEMVNRFLAWPLPLGVCADLCATMEGVKHRSGTNLLTAIEAKAMFEHCLAAPPGAVVPAPQTAAQPMDQKTENDFHRHWDSVSVNYGFGMENSRAYAAMREGFEFALSIAAPPAAGVDATTDWLSVEDQLPEPEVDVWCFDGRDIFQDWFGSKKDCGRGVTHWFPLVRNTPPAPPAATKTPTPTQQGEKS